MLGHPGVGWGEELEMSPLNGAQSRPGQPPPRTHFPSVQGPLPHLIYRTPLLPAPLGCREPGKGGKAGLGRGPAVPPSPAPSPQAACLLPRTILLLRIGRG